MLRKTSTPARRTTRSGQKISLTAAFPTDYTQCMARTPEERLWIQVLLEFHEDILAKGCQDRETRLSLADSCRLDFVALALGLPSDTLPRLLRRGEQTYAESRRKEIHLA